MNIKSMTVYCGAAYGVNPAYEKAAYEFGRSLAEKEIKLVYGGGALGLMGSIANGVLENGGEVTGVMPRFLTEREAAHPGVEDMRIVETMHERKTLLEGLGDAIVALPGGAGTLEELFEVFTWGQIGLHKKPIGILNTENFYDDLINMFHKLVDSGFLEERYMSQIFVDNSLDDLLQQFNSHVPASVRTYKDLVKRHRS
ncbi:LOG family protein [Corticicoccus populi]|uniref:Cytokinin riboside 5'-monophosphate phosphoribohydrolase n=1 Tax=Corticicoccus populi TaxID=1812821 RepID=A0ABW5WYB6_9STAP